MCTPCSSICPSSRPIPRLYLPGCFAKRTVPCSSYACNTPLACRGAAAATASVYAEKDWPAWASCWIGIFAAPSSEAAAAASGAPTDAGPGGMTSRPGRRAPTAQSSAGGNSWYLVEQRSNVQLIVERRLAEKFERGSNDVVEAAGVAFFGRLKSKFWAGIWGAGGTLGVCCWSKGGSACRMALKRFRCLYHGICYIMHPSLF